MINRLWIQMQIQQHSLKLMMIRQILRRQMTLSLVVMQLILLLEEIKMMQISRLIQIWLLEHSQ